MRCLHVAQLAGHTAVVSIWGPLLLLRLEIFNCGQAWVPVRAHAAPRPLYQFARSKASGFITCRAQGPSRWLRSHRRQCQRGNLQDVAKRQAGWQHHAVQCCGQSCSGPAWTATGISAAIFRVSSYAVRLLLLCGSTCSNSDGHYLAPHPEHALALGRCTSVCLSPSCACRCHARDSSP